MKVSEKSLELNVGAELLFTLRNDRGLPNAYLRGLTQREESQEGVEFFAQLDPAARVFAFQFKAPKGKSDTLPYRYTLMRKQHDLLYNLAQNAPQSVFYVLPFYVTEPKLRQDVPVLLQDTWLLRIDQMDTASVFGTTQKKTIRCIPGLSSVNPEYKTELFVENQVSLNHEGRTVPVELFAESYRRYWKRESTDRKWRNPWLARGLRIVVVSP